MALNKEIREKVWLKCGKHCAYCGTKIEYKQMQVDHIEAHWHSYTDEQCVEYGLKKGSNEFDNFNPACVRCNRWKGTMSLETFRKEIQMQLERLKKRNNNYRMAFDFGMIKEDHKLIVFYFEKIKAPKLNEDFNEMRVCYMCENPNCVAEECQD